MTEDQVKDWVDRGYALTQQGYNLAPDQFWPEMGRRGQGQATAWAWSVFLLATTSRLGDYQPGPPNRTLDFGAPWGSVNHRAAKRHVLNHAWRNGGPANHHRRHTPHEVLVDLTVHDWYNPSPLLASAESEMCSTWGVGSSISGDDDYSWDFYKLLLVPSPFRLFFCRVGAFEDETGEARRDQLIESLYEIFDLYRGLVRDEDEVGAVVLAEDWRDDEWRDSRWVVFSPQGHRSGLLWPPP